MKEVINKRNSTASPSPASAVFTTFVLRLNMLNLNEEKTCNRNVYCNKYVCCNYDHYCHSDKDAVTY